MSATPSAKDTRRRVCYISGGRGPRAGGKFIVRTRVRRPVV